MKQKALLLLSVGSTAHQSLHSAINKIKGAAAESILTQLSQLAYYLQHYFRPVCYIWHIVNSLHWHFYNNSFAHFDWTGLPF